MKVTKRAGTRPLRCLESSPPEPGEHVLGRDPGGLRHFLDGRPVYCGTFLERVVSSGVYAVVRYEASLYRADAPALLYERDVAYEASATDRFRWPRTQDHEAWWVDNETTIDSDHGFVHMVAIRDENRLLVAFARPDDAERVAAAGGA